MCFYNKVPVMHLQQCGINYLHKFFSVQCAGSCAKSISVVSITCITFFLFNVLGLALKVSVWYHYLHNITHSVDSNDLSITTLQMQSSGEKFYLGRRKYSSIKIIRIFLNQNNLNIYQAKDKDKDKDTCPGYKKARSET